MKPGFVKSKVLYLHPGEIIFTKRPVVVSTVLGSCLSITMFNARTKMAGISHCQLPVCPEREVRMSNCKEPFKYVESTLDKMLERFHKNNVFNEEIEIKMFGGGDVLLTADGREGSPTVGHKNIIAAMNYLKKHNLKLAAKDVGGKTGRKIFFLTDTGDVYLNRLHGDEEN